MITGRKEEDRAFVCEGGHVMGVFDGHLGPNMAEFAVDNFHQELRKAARNAGAKWGSDGNDWARLESFSAANDVLCAAFKSCHETARGHRKRGGTTALVFWSCLIDGHRTGFCANAGDSRAVLSCSGGKAQRLSVDHTADVSEEVARVELAGGRVDVKLGLLVDPADGDAELKVTRGLGNFNLEPGFTSDPHVSAAVDLDAAGVEFVILGSDGLWDKVTDEEAVTIAHRKLLAGLSPQMVSHVLAETATGLHLCAACVAHARVHSSPPLLVHACRSWVARRHDGDRLCDRRAVCCCGSRSTRKRTGWRVDDKVGEFGVSPVGQL